MTRQIGQCALGDRCLSPWKWSSVGHGMCIVATEDIGRHSNLVGGSRYWEDEDGRGERRGKKIGEGIVER